LKISDLIRELQELKAERGDIDVFAWDPHEEAFSHLLAVDRLHKASVRTSRHPLNSAGATIAVVEA
jgi:hypothetical protein